MNKYNEQELVDRWSALLRGNKAFVICRVTAIDGILCTVVPVDGDLEITGVRLSFDDDPDTLITPADGSIVVVGKSKINKTEKRYFIVYCTKAASIKLHGDEWSTTKSEILKTELAKTNAVVNFIKNALTTWSPIANDGGAALKLIISGVPPLTGLSGLSVGDFDSIGNSNVKHG